MMICQQHRAATEFAAAIESVLVADWQLALAQHRAATELLRDWLVSPAFARRTPGALVREATIAGLVSSTGREVRLLTRHLKSRLLPCAEA